MNKTLQYNRSITLDLSGECYADLFITKQGDKLSRYLDVTLLSHGVEYIIPDETVARVAWKKPDGNQVLNDAKIIKNHVRFELTQQMLIVSGNVKCEIMLFHGNSLLTSSVFETKIMPNVLDAEKIESTPEYQTFVEALQSVDGAVEKCETATSAAEIATLECITATGECTEAVEACIEATQSAYEAAHGYSIINNPVTGTDMSVQETVNGLYSFIILLYGQSITVEEFDDLELTAGEFDGKGLTIQEFDTKAKQILIGG